MLFDEGHGVVEKAVVLSCSSNVIKVRSTAFEGNQLVRIVRSDPNSFYIRAASFPCQIPMNSFFSCALEA